MAEAAAPDVGIAVDPWPSDHHAVVSTFSVVPLPIATIIVAEPRAVPQGEPLVLRFRVGDTPDGRMEDGIFEILPAGVASGFGEALGTLRTNDTTDRFGATEIATVKLPPGAYEAALVNSDAVEIGRAPFFVLPADSRPSISTDKDSYAPGETFTAILRGAPGNRYDWIAVYRADQVEPMDYWASTYSGALIDGEVPIDEETTWGPLEPGLWELRLLRDDSYTAIAVSPPFRVTRE